MSSELKKKCVWVLKSKLYQKCISNTLIIMLCCNRLGILFTIFFILLSDTELFFFHYYFMFNPQFKLQLRFFHPPILECIWVIFLLASVYIHVLTRSLIMICSYMSKWAPFSAMSWQEQVTFRWWCLLCTRLTRLVGFL